MFFFVVSPIGSKLILMSVLELCLVNVYGCVFIQSQNTWSQLFLITYLCLFL